MAVEQVDWTRRDAAYQLASRIEDYWREYGYIVRMEVARHQPGGDKQNVIYFVCSDMVDGLPRVAWAERNAGRLPPKKAEVL